jgi:hypothetical protein
MRKHQEEIERERRLLEQQRAEVQAASAEASRRALEAQAEVERAREEARAAEAARTVAQQEAEKAAARKRSAEEAQRRIAENIRRDAEEARVRQEMKRQQAAQAREAAEAEQRKRNEDAARRQQEEARARHTHDASYFQPFMPKPQIDERDRAPAAGQAMREFLHCYEGEFLNHAAWGANENAKIRSRLVKKLAVAVSFDKCGKGPLNEEAIARARTTLQDLDPYFAPRVMALFDKCMRLLRQVFPNGTEAVLCDEISKLSYQYVK